MDRPLQPLYLGSVGTSAEASAAHERKPPRRIAPYNQVMRSVIFVVVLMVGGVVVVFVIAGRVIVVSIFGWG